MEMDLNRYEQITGREAIGKLLEGERVFFKSYGEVHHYEISRNELLVTTSPSGYSYATLRSFLKEADTNWYVRKPFDVRAEMLARPNEWVGAFESKRGWHYVGFDEATMTAVKSLSDCYEVDINAFSTYHLQKDELDACILIEDVPEEEQS